MLPDLTAPAESAERASGEREPGPAPLTREIDLANIVTSAAKGLTTVQEAPSIVTIITGDEIRQRGYRRLGQALATVPGWIDIEAIGNQIELPLVRGLAQAALLLRDGVSFFDPAFNIATMTRVQPLETVKRIEVVTGPGGVLWGANSFLGIVNVISKDADDVHGLEVSAGYGDGRGDASDFRAYAMYGASLFGRRLKVLAHASYESFLGPQYSMRQFYVSSPAPQPAGPAIYGASVIDTSNARSWIVNLDTKLSLGPLSLYLNYPLGEINPSLNFSTGLLVGDKGKGDLDRTTWNFYDRYAILEYRSRFAHDKLGLDAKLFYIQFNRDLGPRVFVSSGLLQGGLKFRVDDLNIQRFGGTLDGDIAGPWSWNRVLFGAEAFTDRMPTSHSVFVQPDADRLPLVCPIGVDMVRTEGCRVPFTFGTDRTVIGLFVDDQIRPFETLTLDGGVRYQQGFGKRGYDPQLLVSASAVWRFYTDMHLKLNYAQGFRPPVFNNTDSNGAATQYGGNPALVVERSDALQAELNARLLRNTRHVRELQLRLDYAYTLLNNVIIINAGRYGNTGRRGIHTAEVYGRLYLEGDHAITFGYTFLTAKSSDQGEIRNVPNHWFSIGAVWSVVSGVLDVNGTLNVFGAYDDPNRVPTLSYALPEGPAVAARYSDIVVDRLSPVAWLQVGARLRLWQDRVAVSAQVYNLLNQHFYYPDAFNDQAPTVEMRPTPAPGLSFFASVTYHP